MKHRWMRPLSVGVCAIFWMNQILPTAYAASSLRQAATDGSVFERRLQADTGWVWGPSGNIEAFGRGNLVSLGREIVRGAMAEGRVFDVAGTFALMSIDAMVDLYARKYTGRYNEPIPEERKQELTQQLKRAQGILEEAVRQPLEVEINGVKQWVSPLEEFVFEVVMDEVGSPSLVNVGVDGAAHLALVAYAETEVVGPERIRLSLEQILGLADLGEDGLTALRLIVEHEVRDAVRGYHVDEPLEVRDFVNAKIARVVEVFKEKQGPDQTRDLLMRMETAAAKAQGLVKEREHEMVFEQVARYFEGGVIPEDRMALIHQRLIASLPTGQISPVDSPYVRQQGNHLVVSVLYRGPEESAVVTHHIMTIVQQVLTGPAPLDVAAVRQKYQDEYSVSVRLGGNNIAVGLVNRNGDVENSTALPEFNWRRAFFGEGEDVNEEILALVQQGGEEARQVADDIVAEIARHIRWVIETTGLPLSSLQHVHVSFPGPVNQPEGLVGDPFRAPNVPGFDRYPIVDQMQRLLAAGLGVAVPIFIENDAEAGHRGETTAGGTAAGLKDVATMIWGTGINGRGEDEGRLLTAEGWDEIGHALVGRLDERGEAHYEFRGFELKGKRPQLKEGEFEVEQRLGGEALKARFQALGYRDAQHVSEVAAGSALVRGRDEAGRAIIDVGSEMGRAIAALLQPFLDLYGFFAGAVHSHLRGF